MRKQLLIFLIASLVGNFQLKAQVNKQTDSLFIQALGYYLVSCDSSYHRYPKIYNRIDTIFLEQTAEISQVPPVINGRKIIVLTPENWKKMYKQNGNRLIHSKIFPIELKGDEIEITITPYHGSMVKNKLSLSLSDWTTIYFKYDCDRKKWLFSRFETGGI